MVSQHGSSASSGCHNKYHRLGGYKQEFLSHSFGGWEVHDEVASRFVVVSSHGKTGKKK